MATSFETYVTTELPRRSAFLTFEITSWDASPNAPGAPNILTLAPKGAEFREKTAKVWWRKNELSWEVVAAGSSPAGSHILNSGSGL